MIDASIATFILGESSKILVKVLKDKRVPQEIKDQLEAYTMRVSELSRQVIDERVKTDELQEEVLRLKKELRAKEVADDISDKIKLSLTKTHYVMDGENYCKPCYVNYQKLSPLRGSYVAIGMLCCDICKDSWRVG